MNLYQYLIINSTNQKYHNQSISDRIHFHNRMEIGEEKSVS